MAADARLVEVLVGMAQEQAAAAAAVAAAAAEGNEEEESICGEGEASGGGERCSQVAAGAGGSGCGAPTWEASRLAATCLLLRSMARSAYITGRPEPAAAFLRRFAQLAGTEGAWFAQLLLQPVLLLLSRTVSVLPPVRQLRSCSSKLPGT